jgi:hypothetical protein
MGTAKEKPRKRPIIIRIERLGVTNVFETELASAGRAFDFHDMIGETLKLLERR